MSTLNDASGRTRPANARLREQRIDHRALGRFPGQADADVNRLDLAARGLVREQHGAVETARQQHGAFAHLHLVIWSFE